MPPNVKATITTLALLWLFLAGNAQTINGCFPDKGIKSAILTAKQAPQEGELKTAAKKQTIEYDNDGRPLIIHDAAEGTRHVRKYTDGKLQTIVTTRKDLPDFYLVEHLDSLMATAPDKTDSARILAHTTDGRPKEMHGADGITLLFEYKGCEEQLQTVFDAAGDTLQQTRLIYREGVLVESIWTPFVPMKSTRSTIYYDYEFNKHGHWVERKYKRRNGVVVEKRVLNYF